MKNSTVFYPQIQATADGGGIITHGGTVHVVVARARPEPHLRTLRYEEPSIRNRTGQDINPMKVRG